MLKLRFFVIPLWGLLLSSVMIHWVLSGSVAIAFYYVFLACASFVAGLVVLDLERAVIGSFIAFGLCALLMFIELSLPVLVGAMSYALLGEMVYYEAIRKIFTTLVPIPFVLNTAAAVVGSYFGERYFPD